MAESYPSGEGTAPESRGKEIRGIGITASDDGRAAELSALVSALVPTAPLVRLEARALALPPDLPAVVIDSATGGMETPRRLRAIGYEGALVLVSPQAPSEDASVEAARLGVVVSPEGEELGAALADALHAGTERTELGAAVRRSRRLLAAGSVALQLQHSINNPLAALLAEAQLLEMEELNGDQLAAVRRMVDLCRRVNALVRELDGISRPREG